MGGTFVNLELWIHFQKYYATCLVLSLVNLFSHPSLHLSPFPLFSPPVSFLPPLVSFLPVSLYTVRPLITDAQTGQKKPIYKYIPQLRT